MDDRIARLESSVADLRELVASLQQRVDRLDQAGPARTRSSTDRPEAPTGARPRRAPNDPIALLSLTGRLFLVLAGGFFLRALTESAVLPTPLGLTIGFGYALAWLYFADRAGRRREVQAAGFHALGTALIAFPLLIEAATKFKVLPGGPSAIAVALLCAAMFVVAWWQRINVVAWIALVGTLPTSAILLAQTGAAAPFALLLIVVGVATLWFGYTLDWWGLRWPAALAADLAVVGVTMRVLAPTNPDPAQVAILLQLTLLGAYVASIAVRTLLRGRNVVPFEVAQTVAVLLVGFGGSLYLARTTGIMPATIGWVSLAMGAASYGIAIAFLDRRKGAGPNVYYYTTLGLVHALAGLALLIDLSSMTWVVASLAVVAALSWARLGRSFMLVHATVYLLAASIVSGVLRYGLQTLALPGPGPWSTPTMPMFAVLTAGACCAWLASARRASSVEQVARGLRVAIAVLLVVAVCACAIGSIGPFVAARTDGSVDAGTFATVSTGVLALVALAVAWVSGNARFQEWAWLVYPMLVGIGVKMAMEDFKHSRPSTLFIAMALYGAALILAPRLRRKVTTTRELPEPERAIGSNA